MRYSSEKAKEYNFDGLIGPTHNYAGLSAGNLASMQHKSLISHPRKAALEGLEKMKFLMDKGFKQAILPPHERPDLNFLKDLGFTGTIEKQLRQAGTFSPVLLSTCWSASAMWTANSATVSPSADTKDHKVHFTPANLQSFPHRSLETKQSSLILKKIFADPRYFTHHPPLPAVPAFSDEGAANHNRLCAEGYGSEGMELFVYGHEGSTSPHHSQGFYPRQSLWAGRLIALRHKLKSKNTLTARQNPKAIDAGVFHNDVICVADQNLIFYHEQAFINTSKVIREIKNRLSPAPLWEAPVRAKDISLQTAVSSYLFNSQLLPIGKNKWLLLAPAECRRDPVVRDYIKFLNRNTVIKEVHFMPIRQSMQNGGGPACLRLRVTLTGEQARAIHRGVCLTPLLYKELKAWICKHYRDRLKPEDLLDPLLVQESRTALDALSRLLKLGPIYPFQL